MAKGYLPLRRDEVMLLPPDPRDWLPADHVVWFLIDAVAALDTTALHRRAKLGGAGRAPYDPDMLLVVLLYAYAGGLRSSRKIERRCREDVAFMVASGLCYPDHATIARFRKDGDAAVEDLFVQVLRLCGRAGMGRLEHVAIDGTKLAADASPQQSRDAGGLRRVARRLLDEAAAVDAAEDAEHGPDRGDELPEDLRDPQRRRARIAELIEQASRDPDVKRGRARARKADKAGRALALADGLDADAVDKAATADPMTRAIARVARTETALAKVRATTQAAAEDRARREAAAAAQGRTLPGTRPVPVEGNARVRQAVARLDRARQHLTAKQSAALAAQATGKRNLTDPDSRFMPIRGGRFILGYNGQLAVSADYLILTVDLVQDTNDEHQLVPMLDRLDHAVTVLRDATANPHLSVGVTLFDAGYDSAANLTHPGPDRLIAIGKRDQIAGAQPPTSPPGPDAAPRDQMAWRLNTPDGQTLYKKRGATVEPVNSHLKDPRGLRRFIRRGLTAAKAELTLAALTTNLLRLHTHQTQPT